MNFPKRKHQKNNSHILETRVVDLNINHDMTNKTSHARLEKFLLQMIMRHEQ